ncbi:unnamed protein product, partial [Musa acuminata var. zebrina]
TPLPRRNDCALPPTTCVVLEPVLLSLPPFLRCAHSFILGDKVIQADRNGQIHAAGYKRRGGKSQCPVSKHIGVRMMKISKTRNRTTQSDLNRAKNFLVQSMSYELTIKEKCLALD